VLHATAAGRAWLTTLDEDEAVRIVQKKGFSIPTRFNRSIPMNARFAQNCAPAASADTGSRTRRAKQGVAMACPIFVPLEKKTRAVGTVSIAGPMVRMTSKRIIQISKELKAAALEIFSDMANAAFR
jgi:IclR family acetate operon transcriptional repressor